MRNQLAKVKGHFRARLAHAHFAAIPSRLKCEVHSALIPRIAQFIQGHRHRAEGRGRFALEETKAFGQFVGNEVAQADIVGNHDQANAVECIFGCHAHGHIAGDHGNFCFKVDAKCFVTANHRIAWANEVIAATLVHEGIVVKAGRHFRTSRCTHQLHVVQIGRTIGPLIGPGQRRHALLGVKRKRVARFA